MKNHSRGSQAASAGGRVQADEAGKDADMVELAAVDLKRERV